MSKGGGGGGSTTQVQKADPWPGLQGPLKSLYGGAMDNYNTGGPQYYPGQTVAPSNDFINQAINMGVSRAGQGQDPMLGAASGSLQQTMQGRSPSANPAYPTLANFAGGNAIDNPAMAGLGQLGSNSGTFGQMAQGGGTFGKFAQGNYVGSNPAQDYFQSSTNGNFLDKQNPWLKQLVESAQRPVVSQFQNAIAPAMASQFSAAGRTGSGAHEAAFGQASDALGRNLGDISTGIYGTAYENERNRQQASAGQLAQMNESERAQQLQGAQGEQQGKLAGAQGMASALGTMGGLFQDQRGQQLRGAEDITNQYGAERDRQQQAALAAPGMATTSQNLDFDRIAKMMGSGQYMQGQQQQLIDADKARYDFGQERPLMNLQALNQLLQGGSVYGTKSTSGSEQTNRNPFAGAVGGLMTTAGLGTAFGLPSAMAGPILGAGTILGGLFG